MKSLDLLDFFQGLETFHGSRLTFLENDNGM